MANPATIEKKNCKGVIRNTGLKINSWLWLMDPDPAIFVIDLQDANKKQI
jgi:hypothetical protein